MAKLENLVLSGLIALSSVTGMGVSAVINGDIQINIGADRC